MQIYKSHINSIKIISTKYLRVHIVLFFLLITHSHSIAQNYADLGSWNLINVNYVYSDKINFFGEAQIRSLKFYNHFHYHEYKGGITYRVQPGMRIALAAGKYDTYKEGGDFILPKNNDEYRIWPMIQFNQSLKKFNIEQRYRYELRISPKGYRNRFRARLGINYSFGKEVNGKQRYQISINNEIFLTNNEPYFERNRFLATLSYRLTNNVMLQAGYLRQLDYKINDETGREFLQLGLYIEFKRLPKTENN